MKFLLEIELGNDAMQTFVDVGMALGDLGKELRSTWSRVELAKPTPSFSIYDDNGNTVGGWKIEE